MRTIPSFTRKFVSVSGLALATAMAAKAPVAQAQSFQGTVNSTFGAVSVVQGTTTTDVFVSGNTAVINWTPNDQAATGGPINFQPVGTTATFTGTSGSGTDFTVLNRIIPLNSTRPIQFNGSVISQLQISGPPVAGGQVFFYSPGGILLGGGALFDVGSLALTTSDLLYDADGNFDTAGSYVFQPASVPGSQINILSGARITTSVDGSYVALVAPSVVNGGTIDVNGSAALVAADAATITFSPSGLFDIQVDSGTSATGTVAANNGTITGPAASSFFHRIYMVAVAKNDAITMAIGSGSTLGFDIAGAADVVGNSIVLSAGHDVVNGSPAIAPSAGGGAGQVSITGGDASITSNFRATSNGGVSLGSTTAGGLDFASSVIIDANGASSSLFATGAGAVTVTGDVVMDGRVVGTDPALAAAGQAVEIRASNGGAVTIGGEVQLLTGGQGANAVVSGTSGGAGVGGDARIEARNGGQIVISGNVSIDANGFGGGVGISGASAGNGAGGTAVVLATGTAGSSVQILGNASFSASGIGGAGTGCSTCVPASGSGEGGAVTIQAAGSNSVSIGGATAIFANGDGGDTTDGSAGSGVGGIVNVSSSSGGDLVVHDFAVTANGTGGDGPAGAGLGLGGTIVLSTLGTGGGSATLAGQVNLIAEGYGGGASGSGGLAASGTGGSVTVTARDGTTLQFDSFLNGSANGVGGFGFSGSAAGLGGQVALNASAGGVITVGQDTQLTANGSGGTHLAGQVASPGSGGTAQITLNTGGSVQFGNALITANGIGSGVSVNSNGLGGDGFGGTAGIIAAGNSVVSFTGTAEFSATGTGGSGGGAALSQGGSGTGGTSSISLTDAQGTVDTDITIDASGIGGRGTAISQTGVGGTAGISLLNSTFNATGDVYIGSIGAGGDSLGTGVGGSGTGGGASFILGNSTATLVSTLTVETTGNAGSGSGVAAAAAAGQGGVAAVEVNSGTLSVTNAIQILSDGAGGQGMNFGDGGVGTGGTAAISANGDLRGSSLITADTYLLRADGLGGEGDGAARNPSNFSGANGANGGNAQGGTINVNAAADGGTITGTILQAGASALGGLGGNGFSSSASGTPGSRGGNGGSAIGGTITVDSNRLTGTTSGALDFGDVSLTATGTGQAGGAGAFGSPRGEGGNGGSGTGGTIAATFDRGGSQLLVSGSVNAAATGIGGDAGACDIGCLSNGGNATGGNIFFGSSGTTTGNVVSVGVAISLAADATGGSTLGAAGGNALGGTAEMQASAGLTLGATDLLLQATANGGDASSAGAAGAAQGGLALILARGNGAINAGGSVFMTTAGTGGNGLGDLTAGGAGTGGTTRISGVGGTVTVLGDAYVVANGFGGAGNQFASSGTGGSGTGGLAAISAGLPSDLGNGSALSFGGLTFVTADGQGGDAWAAGDGIGGQTAIHARNGSASFGAVLIGARGAGGFGTSGGSGGDGTGGELNFIAGNAIEGPSLISVSQLTADVSGAGGDGSQSEGAGVIGGSGGLAEAGFMVIAGSSGNGVLQAGITSAIASASGGAGGAGNGASGGNGGNAIAGSVQIGSISGIDTGSLNIGSATYFNISATANAIGGAGGAGDSGVAGAVGGNGGNATGGGTSLLVRGSPVTVTGTGVFQANASGGNGGLGSAVGSGGTAAVGNVDPLLVSGAYALVTNRLGQPAQRGNLVAADLVFASSATGGAGLTTGSATNLGNAISFHVENSAVSAANMSFFSLSPGTASPGGVDPISLTDSTAAISGLFQVNTTSATSLSLGASSLSASVVAIGAANWLLDPVTPATIGTLTGATSLVLTSAQNLVAHANLATQSSLTLAAPGRIDFGTVNALGFVDATAGGTITLDDISSADSIDLASLGAITVGNLSAATSITVDTQGNVTTANLAAGSGAPTGANGDLNSVGIRSGGSVATGSIFAASDLGISAAGAISTGLATAYDMQLLGGGSVSLGGVAASNRVLIANAAMAALGLTATGFNKELVFAATPVTPTAGPIAISGPVSATAFSAATQATFTSGAITVVPSATGSGRLLIDAGGALTATTLSSANAIGLSSAVSIQTGNLASQASTISLVAPTINIGAVQAATNIVLSGNSLATGSLATTSGSVTAQGVQTVSLGAIAANGPITVTGGSQTTVGSVTSTNGYVEVTSGGALDIGDVTSSADYIELTAFGPVLTGNLTAATSITAETQGGVTTGNIAAGAGTPTGANGDLNSVGIRSGGSVSTGSIFAASDLGIVAGTSLTIGQATAYDMLLLSSGSVSTGGLAASNRVRIANASMAALGQSASGFNKEPVFAATSATRTAGPIAIAGPVSATAFSAATQAAFTSGGMIVVPSATGSGRLVIDAGGALTTANLSAANAIDLNSAISIDTRDITSQTSTVSLVAPAINVGVVQGLAGVSISGQTVTTENLEASAGSVSAIGTQTIVTEAVRANGSITITGGSQTTVGSASATNGLIAVTSAGALGIGDVTASVGGVRLIAGPTTATGVLVAGQGSINALSVQAGGQIQLAAGGAIASGTLRSTAQGVKVASVGSTVITGNINARTDALVSAAQSLTVGGTISARDVIVLSGGNVATGAVFAGIVIPATGGQITNATGRVLIASNAMATGNLLQSTSTDYSALFTATPARLAGTINVGGPLVAARFVSFSQGAMTGAAISAFGSLEVESGGLVTVAQRWGAPSLLITSADIRIVDNGTVTGPTGQTILSGLRTTPTGSVGLISIGNSPALIGDGLTGTGYALSAAEIALVSTAELAIGAIDIATNPVDMLIGDLALTAGGNIGSSIASGSTGLIAFATGNRQNQTPSGTIRVVGNVTGTGFAESNVVAFTTGRFELDAATGSISLTQTGTALGGTVELDAANIHVASGAILDRLAVDPFYDGHVADLNRPAAVQRPEGVLRALGLDLFPTGTLYIQNTGTTLDPAGFFADFEFTDLTPPANAAPASISVIVNGKWQTLTGIVGGIDARDLVVNNADTLAFYTADSSVNGCAISATACVSEQTVDPTPAISSQIQVITNDPLGSTPQFTEEPPAQAEPESGETEPTAEEEEEARQVAEVEAENASSPLVPPAQLIDSTPLEPQLMIEQPVAGSGNPSLIGQVINEASAEGIAQ